MRVSLAHKSVFKGSDDDNTLRELVGINYRLMTDDESAVRAFLMAKLATPQQFKAAVRRLIDPRSRFVKSDPVEDISLVEAVLQL